MQNVRRSLFTGAALLVLLAGIVFYRAQHEAHDWPAYGNNSAGQRFSDLTQINLDNVTSLREAWRLETGPGALQTSPIAIDGIVYAYAADQSVIAVAGDTGKELWRFNSGTPSFQPARGVTYWRNGSERRLFVSSRTMIYALDPATGKPVVLFGNQGRIDLREGPCRSAGQIPHLSQRRSVRTA